MRVQTYGERRVAPEALPGARKTAAETPTSLGANVQEAKASTAIAQGAAANVVSDKALGYFAEQQRQKREAEQRAKDEADREAKQLQQLEWDKAGSDWENQALYGEGGALTLKGKDAVGSAPKVLEAYDQETAKLGTGINDPAQRSVFEQTRLRRRMAIDLQLSRHSYEELQGYKQSELSGAIDGRIQSAIAKAKDPESAAEDIAAAVQQMKTVGPTLGMGPKELEEQISKITTQAHQGIINRLAVSNPDWAQHYYEQHKSEIRGSAQKDIEDTLKEGNLRLAGQKGAEALMAQFPDDPAAQLAAAHKNYSGEEEAKIVNELTNRHNEIKWAQQLQAEDAMTNASTIMYAMGKQGLTPTTDKVIPPDVWTKLTYSQKEAMTTLADSLAPGKKKVQTDMQAFYYLSQQATSLSATERALFQHANLLDYAGKLDTNDLQHFMEVQGKMREGDQQAGQKLLTSEATQNKMVDEAIRAIGLDPTPPVSGQKGFDQGTVDRVDAFRRQVREQVRKLEADKKDHAPATDEEVQNIVDDLRKPTYKGEGGLFGLRSGQQFYTFETTPKAYTSPTLAGNISDVPVYLRQEARQDLIRRHLPYDDQAIVALYNSWATAMGAKEATPSGQPKNTPKSGGTEPPKGVLDPFLRAGRGGY